MSITRRITYRVALDARKLTRPLDGIGRYVHELANGIVTSSPDIEVHLLSDAPLLPQNRVEGCREAVIGPRGFSAPCWRKPLAPFWIRFSVPAYLRAAEVDLFHGTNFLVPRTFGCPMVVTVHDMAFVETPFAYDVLYRKYLRVLAMDSVRRASQIVTVSRHAKNDLVRLWRVDAARVAPIPHGVGPEFHAESDTDYLAGVRSDLRLPDRYVLHVGVVETRKNIETLLRASVKALDERLIDAVVLAGGTGAGADRVERLAQDLGIRSKVHLLGYVHQQLLRGLYTLAQALAMPSWYEGFGMPVLEAMACGCPVLSSNVSSLPEVAGDAALLVAPDDVDGWTAALRRVLCDDELRNRLRQQGLERASRFTWRAAAAAHVEVYRKVLESRGRT